MSERSTSELRPDPCHTKIFVCNDDIVDNDDDNDDDDDDDDYDDDNIHDDDDGFT